MRRISGIFSTLQRYAMSISARKTDCQYIFTLPGLGCLYYGVIYIPKWPLNSFAPWIVLLQDHGMSSDDKIPTSKLWKGKHYVDRSLLIWTGCRRLKPFFSLKLQLYRVRISDILLLSLVYWPDSGALSDFRTKSNETQ